MKTIMLLTGEGLCLCPAPDREEWESGRLPKTRICVALRNGIAPQRYVGIPGLPQDTDPVGTSSAGESSREVAAFYQPQAEHALVST